MPASTTFRPEDLISYYRTKEISANYLNQITVDAKGEEGKQIKCIRNIPFKAEDRIANVSFARGALKLNPEVPENDNPRFLNRDLIQKFFNMLLLECATNDVLVVKFPIAFLENAPLRSHEYKQLIISCLAKSSQKKRILILSDDKQDRLAERNGMMVSDEEVTEAVKSICEQGLNPVVFYDALDVQPNKASFEGKMLQAFPALYMLDDNVRESVTSKILKSQGQAQPNAATPHSTAQSKTPIDVKANGQGFDSAEWNEVKREKQSFNFKDKEVESVRTILNRKYDPNAPENKIGDKSTTKYFKRIAPEAGEAKLGVQVSEEDFYETVYKLEVAGKRVRLSQELRNNIILGKKINLQIML